METTLTLGWSGGGTVVYNNGKGMRLFFFFISLTECELQYHCRAGLVLRCAYNGYGVSRATLKTSQCIFISGASTNIHTTTAASSV